MLFKRTAVGVFIDDRVIEIAAVRRQGADFLVQSAARVEVPAGVIADGVIQDEKQLAEIFQGLLETAQPQIRLPRTIICTLPIATTFTRLIYTKDSNREEVARKEIQENIPLATSDVLYAYTPPLEETEKKKAVLLVASSEAVIAAWRDFFARFKLTVLFDVRQLAAYRAVSIPKKAKTVCLVDMGSAICTLSVFSRDVLYYSYGRAFTTKEDAFIKELTAEIQNTIATAQGSYKKSVDAIVLIAASPEHAAHLKKAFDISVTKATARVRPKSSVHVSTVGLAMRQLNTAWDALHPLLSTRNAQSLDDIDAPPKEAEAVEEEDLEVVIHEQQEEKRLSRQKIMLVAVAFLGVVALVGAFMFRSHERAEHEKQLNEATQYTQTQTFALQVPIATRADDYTSENVAGRIHDVVVQSSGGYQEAVANAKRTAEEQLADGEVVWETPLNAPTETTDVTFPLSVEWLIYAKDQADELFAQKIVSLNTNDVSYALSGITVTGIHKKDGTPSLYELSADVTVSLNELFPILSPDEEVSSSDETGETTEQATDEENVEAEPVNDAQRVRILDTPTGWLNVRSGPGTNHERIDRVSPGDTYVLREESGEWYNIQLSDDVAGWIFSDFAEVE